MIDVAVTRWEETIISVRVKNRKWETEYLEIIPVQKRKQLFASTLSYIKKYQRQITLNLVRASEHWTNKQISKEVITMIQNIYTQTHSSGKASVKLSHLTEAQNSEAKLCKTKEKTIAAIQLPTIIYRQLWWYCVCVDNPGLIVCMHSTFVTIPPCGSDWKGMAMN